MRLIHSTPPPRFFFFRRMYPITIHSLLNLKQNIQKSQILSSIIIIVARWFCGYLTKSRHPHKFYKVERVDQHQVKPKSGWIHVLQAHTVHETVHDLLGALALLHRVRCPLTHNSSCCWNLFDLLSVLEPLSHTFSVCGLKMGLLIQFIVFLTCRLAYQKRKCPFRKTTKYMKHVQTKTSCCHEHGWQYLATICQRSGKWSLHNSTQRRFTKTHSHWGGKPQDIPKETWKSNKPVLEELTPHTFLTTCQARPDLARLQLWRFIWKLHVCLLQGAPPWLIPAFFFGAKILGSNGKVYYLGPRHSFPKSLQQPCFQSSLDASWPKAGAWGRCTSACQSCWRKVRLRGRGEGSKGHFLLGPSKNSWPPLFTW